MTTINRTALVSYSAVEMFDLVNDVASYPLFLPWCREARVLSEDGDEMRASINLAKGAVQRTFTTINRIQRGKMIEMRLADGPFRQLEGFWRFEPLGEQACKVYFDIDFEFSSRVVSIALGPVFEQICSTLVDCFHKRAREIYGKR